MNINNYGMFSILGTPLQSIYLTMQGGCLKTISLFVLLPLGSLPAWRKAVDR